MPYRIATNIPNPSADRVVNASEKTSESTDGMRAALKRITISPPVRYRPTLRGDSFSAALPIDAIPPMITSQVRTAIVMPEASLGIPNTVSSTSAIEFGCVKGVVVSAATAATNANSHASEGERSPSRR